MTGLLDRLILQSSSRKKTIVFCLTLLIIPLLIWGLSPGPVFLAPTATPGGIPSPARTGTSTLTATSVPAHYAQPASTYDPQMFSTPTVNPTLLPQAGPENYRLRHLTEKELIQLYNTARVDKEIQEYAGDYYFQQVSLLNEIFLRFPQRRKDEDLQLQLEQLKNASDSNFQYAYLHNLSMEPFRQRMEKALNQDGVQIDTLEDWAKKEEVTFTRPVLKSDNLFGDHQPAFVIRVKCQGSNWGILVVRQKGAKSFSVISLFPQWSSFQKIEMTLQILDLNGNGQDEIAITEDTWGPGMAGWNERRFLLYEWDGKAFQNLMADPFSLETWNATQILDTVIAPDQNGVQTISTQTFHETGCEDAFGYVEQFDYRLNGKVFDKVEKVVLPLENGAPSDCALRWATIAGPRNDQAVSILRKLLQNWPEEITDKRGPASQDYYRLLFGMWLFQRGESEEGLLQFQTVRAHPATPGFIWSVRLADEFLNAYSSGGLIKAVQTFQATLKTKIKSIDADHLYMKSMIPLMGFYDGGEEGVSTVSYLNQFSPNLFMARALQEAQIENGDDLTDWLKKSGLVFEPPQPGDLNGDGVEDWLVEIGWRGEWLEGEKVMKLYAFLHEDANFTPVLIDAYFERGGSASWQSFYPLPGADLVHVARDGEYVFAFRIIKKEGVWQAITDMHSAMYGEGQFSGYSRGWQIKDGPAGKYLEVNYDGSQGIYAWDKKQWKIVPTGYSPEIKEENVSRAEKLIYINNVPSEAIPILENLLQMEIWEKHPFYGEGNANKPFIYPYIQYLLGLAYELSGEETNAVRAYWQLWNDYPNNAYALIAQQKLERIQ